MSTKSLKLVIAMTEWRGGGGGRVGLCSGHIGHVLRNAYLSWIRIESVEEAKDLKWISGNE